MDKSWDFWLFLILLYPWWLFNMNEESYLSLYIYDVLISCNLSSSSFPIFPFEQGACPKIRKEAGSKEKVIWEQGAQKFGKGSREQQKIRKWSKK